MSIPSGTKSTLLAATVALAFLSTADLALAQKKVTRDTAEQTVQTNQQRAAFLKKARGALAEGNRYLDATLLFARLKVLTDSQDDRMKELGGMAPDAKPTIGDVPPAYLKFVKDTKETMLPEAKAFIQSFKKADERSRATDLVAQWITTLDAIGQRNADTEASKFATLANRMELEM